MAAPDQRQVQFESTYASTITLEDLEGHPSFRFDSPGGDRFRRETASLLEMVFKKNLLRRRIASNVLPVKKVSSSAITLGNGQIIRSSEVEGRLKNASHLLGSVCSIGSAIADEIQQLQLAGKHLSAVLLDSIASFSLIRLANQMETNADCTAKGMNLQAGGRINPGDNGFDLSEQSKVLEIAGADQIGVNLSTGHMMTPRFSMSAIFGLGVDIGKPHSDQMCDACNARDRCPHRSFHKPATDSPSPEARP